MLGKKQGSKAPIPLNPHLFTVGAEGLGTYSVYICQSGCNNEQANNFVDKVLQMMKAEGLTYETAMQIPTALHCALSRNFQTRMSKAVIEPLSYNGDDQSNDGDAERKD